MKSPLKILLANDDGLHSNGLIQLEDALSKSADVWALAPDRERSATSQALSIRETLRLHRVRERHFTVSGFPVDCVNVGLHTGRFPKFDLVVSGINHGVNLGDDIHYSGTVGAARHAAIHGIRAVAISSAIVGAGGDYRRIAAWFCQWISENFDDLKVGIVYNINYPEESASLEDPYPAVKYVRQGSRIYSDAYHELEDTPEYTVLKIKEAVMGHREEEDTDFRAFTEGMISVTPLGLDTTNMDELRRWKKNKTLRNVKG